MRAAYDLCNAAQTSLPKADTLRGDARYRGGFVKTVSRLAVVAVALFLNAHPISAEDPLRYREYALQSSVAVVAQTSGTRVVDAKTLHERPAKIQELKWRTPYAATDAVGADPVRDILFSFYDDQLYQVVVTYERTRIDGLTDADLIESLSTVYGSPALTKGARGASSGVDVPPDAVMVARWDKGDSTVVLIRGTFSPGLQLILTSNALNTRARTAIANAIRLDEREAPQREINERKRDAAAVTAAQAKARLQNKAAFRP